MISRCNIVLWPVARFEDEGFDGGLGLKVHKLFCLSIREALVILCLSIERFEEALKECRRVQIRGVKSTIVTQALNTIKKIRESKDEQKES